MQKMGRLSCLRMFSRKYKDKIEEDRETVSIVQIENENGTESKQDSTMNVSYPQTATTVLTNMAFVEKGDFEHEQDCEKESSLLTPFTIEEASSKLTSVVTDDHFPSGEVRIDLLVADNGSSRHYSGSHQSASSEGCDARSADIHNISGHLSDPGLYHSKYLDSTFGSPIIGCISSRSRFEDEEEYRRKDLENNRVLKVTSYQTADSSPVELLPDDNTANSMFNDSLPREHICQFQHESILLPASPKDADGVQNEMAGCSTCIGKMNKLQAVFDCSETLSWHRAEASSEQSETRLDSMRHAMDKDGLCLASSVPSFAEIIESCTWEVLPPKENLKFSGHSGFKRVEEWVYSVDPVAVPPDEKAVTVGAGCDSPSILKPSQQLRVHNLFGQRAERETTDAPNYSDINMMADLDVANTVARSVTPLATIAHLSGFGLRVVPMLGALISLKTLNLSSNAIGRVFPGSLPKGLHSLDLSRNKITAIESLRELSRLRILNLSYNRISRIGQGLANCTSLRELRLANNKISEIEGLHRLTKLCFLDLSFNKLTTTKSLGQLTANYSCLQALDLTGNAVHTNLGDEQLRKFVSGLVPGIIYLNKQTVKAAFAKEVAAGNHIGRIVLGSANHQHTGKSASKAKRIAGLKTDKQHPRSRNVGVLKHFDDHNSIVPGKLIIQKETFFAEQSHQQHLQHPGEL